MPKVCRIGDPFSTGHGCTGTSTVAEGAPTVFANGIPVSRVGDMSVSHTFPVGPNCVPHVVPIADGSATVFATGIEIGRVGDPIDAGQVADGSPDVYAGP
ncbi:PAAR domain-containing protein [Roseovarius pacificus]|uniref:PAAR domain-containing protein n=1 Tax=Roseovarius pacificus TaxID=337701 RepID=UPI002A188976|nr:PAAR domain-containing protein [Roseovarius pacificus]